CDSSGLDRRTVTLVPGARYLLLVALNFSYFYPFSTGLGIRYAAWQARLWLGSRWYWRRSWRCGGWEVVRCRTSPPPVLQDRRGGGYPTRREYALRVDGTPAARHGGGSTADYALAAERRNPAVPDAGGVPDPCRWPAGADATVRSGSPTHRMIVRPGPLRVRVAKCPTHHPR